MTNYTSIVQLDPTGSIVSVRNWDVHLTNQGMFDYAAGWVSHPDLDPVPESSVLVFHHMSLYEQVTNGPRNSVNGAFTLRWERGRWV